MDKAAADSSDDRLAEAGESDARPELERSWHGVRLLREAAIGLELCLRTIEAKLVAFEQNISLRCGSHYAALDGVEAEIAELAAARQPHDEQLREGARRKRAKATETRSDLDRREQEGHARAAEPTKECKSHYRRAARLAHPQLATTEHERLVRQRWMAKLNACYMRGDTVGTREWVLRLEARAPRPPASVSDQLDRVARLHAPLRRRIEELQQETQTLTQTDLHHVLREVQDVAEDGRDVIAKLLDTLDAQTAEARERLEGLGPQGDGRMDPRLDSDRIAHGESDRAECSQRLATRVRDDLRRMQTPRARIVVVEMEELLRELIMETLEKDGHETVGAGNQADGLSLVRERMPDLVVASGCMPRDARGGDNWLGGVDLCRKIREDASVSHVPVLMCWSHSQDHDEVLAIDAGADDCILKTRFRERRLLDLVAPVLRRADMRGRSLVAAGSLRVDPERREVKIADEHLKVSPTQFDILYKLASNPERAISRRELLDRGGEGDDAAVDRTVDVHIQAIRRKLGAFAWLVSEVFGKGYRLGTGPEM